MPGQGEPDQVLVAKEYRKEEGQGHASQGSEHGGPKQCPPIGRRARSLCQNEKVSIERPRARLRLGVRMWPGTPTLIMSAWSVFVLHGRAEGRYGPKSRYRSLPELCSVPVIFVSNWTFAQRFGSHILWVPSMVWDLGFFIVVFSHPLPHHPSTPYFLPQIGSSVSRSTALPLCEHREVRQEVNWLPGAD